MAYDEPERNCVLNQLTNRTFLINVFNISINLIDDDFN